MVIREDEDTLVTALSRIAEAIEDNSDILKGIKAHYDGIVPVMTRNANRAEEMTEEMAKAEDSKFSLQNIFGTPQENN
jgi:hypothetical protein|tara:strand:+ start:465 stop:698 length:234 start_codon:yes stop_codon:yes gene_type:complete